VPRQGLDTADDLCCGRRKRCGSKRRKLTQDTGKRKQESAAFRRQSSNLAGSANKINALNKTVRSGIAFGEALGKHAERGGGRAQAQGRVHFASGRCAAGIQINMDGDDLVLESAVEPPVAVVDLLAEHKVNILAMLRSGYRLRPIIASADMTCAGSADIAGPTLIVATAGIIPPSILAPLVPWRHHRLRRHHQLHLHYRRGH
jgi:hypothetical protein